MEQDLIIRIVGYLGAVVAVVIAGQVAHADLKTRWGAFWMGVAAATAVQVIVWLVDVLTEVTP